MAGSVKEGVAEERKYTRNETQAERKENTQRQSQEGKMILYLLDLDPPISTSPHPVHIPTPYICLLIFTFNLKPLLTRLGSTS